MIDEIQKLQRLTKKDKYVITVTLWENHKVNTECYVNDFPTQDLPIAKNEIGSLLNDTYLKSMQKLDDAAKEESVNNEVKELLDKKG
jgi:hypothetical protein